MRRNLLAARFTAVSLTVVGVAATSRFALAAESPDTTVFLQDRSFHGLAPSRRRERDFALAGTRARNRHPRRQAEGSDLPGLPDRYRPESQEGDLVLSTHDYGSLGFSIGGCPRPWLEVMGDLDIRWAFLEGPPLAADPGTTLDTKRSLRTSFTGITGRFKHAGPIGIPYAELGVGISSSTMSVDGTEYVGIWPIILPIPFTESVNEGALTARVGLGVTFPRENGVEFGIGAKYSSLSQKFGRLGRARVGGLTCNLVFRTHPWSWFGRHLGGGRKK